LLGAKDGLRTAHILAIANDQLLAAKAALQSANIPFATGALLTSTRILATPVAKRSAKQWSGVSDRSRGSRCAFCLRSRGIGRATRFNSARAHRRVWPDTTTSRHRILSEASGGVAADAAHRAKSRSCDQVASRRACGIDTRVGSKLMSLRTFTKRTVTALTVR
jgi:hypothetical protein